MTNPQSGPRRTAPSLRNRFEEDGAHHAPAAAIEDHAMTRNEFKKLLNDVAEPPKPAAPINTDDIIVTAAPPPPATELATQNQDNNRAKLKSDWVALSTAKSIDAMRGRLFMDTGLALSVSVTGVSVYFYLPTPEEIAAEAAKEAAKEQNKPKKERLADAYHSVADLNVTLPNTTKVVQDIRAIPEGEACWKKYTDTPTDAGSIQTATLHKCLGDEYLPLVYEDFNSNAGSPDMALWLSGTMAVMFGIGKIIAYVENKPIKALQKSIRSNPEYNGQPLPGPFKRTQPTLKLDKD
ncbi:hypothetical protein [Micavibrio aeruginosavorus]|uniref:hypothetical protein n=1 Tax=Micavibrio aeruginosavorus TaxID=349221 RepID=UPI003F4AC63C